MAMVVWLVLWKAFSEKAVYDLSSSRNTVWVMFELGGLLFLRFLCRGVICGLVRCLWKSTVPDPKADYLFGYFCWIYFGIILESQIGVSWMI